MRDGGVPSSFCGVVGLAKVGLNEASMTEGNAIIFN